MFLLQLRLCAGVFITEPFKVVDVILDPLHFDNLSWKVLMVSLRNRLWLLMVWTQFPSHLEQNFNLYHCEAVKKAFLSAQGKLLEHIVSLC